MQGAVVLSYEVNYVFFFQVASPIALFYLSTKQTLLPVLIQLHQEKSEHNPVITVY